MADITLLSSGEPTANHPIKTHVFVFSKNFLNERNKNRSYMFDCMMCD